MKFLKNLKDNVLFLIVLFLLAFIPLFPKIPLIDIKNTWVYIRAEDFLVLTTLIVWFIYFLKQKVQIKTPLTIPIIIFWIIGAVATIHGVLIIFPTLANIFPNVAYLAYLRHVEYMSLFFVAFSSIKDRKQLIFIIWTLIITFILVCLYGVGQKFMGFPAYLTMNEEFAKGIPITLSELSRLPSTFAGHYDLAAYLVLIIPIFISLIFGFKNLFMKLFLLLISALGFYIMLMTVSRVSFLVLFIALFAVLYFHKKRLVLIITPVVILLGIIFLGTQSSLIDRYTSTVSSVDVLVDAKTGRDIGHVQFVPFNTLEGKTILIEKISGQSEFQDEVLIKTQIQRGISYQQYASLFKKVPETIPFINANMTSNGEILPQGTSYINLSLSPVTTRLSSFFYETKKDDATTSASVHEVSGDFLVKKAEAYDLSFTTRFQGEWPNTLNAFKRSIFFGSGYGSVSLAVDNNYLRILGEIGLLGFISFAVIFLTLFIYIRKTLPLIDSKLVKSFIYGASAGIIGLSLNAILIDVFEASKIAFLLWLLIGVIAAILTTYHVERLDLKNEIINYATSTYAFLIYIFLGAGLMLLPSLGNYFIGDDFTWFRWAADCQSLISNPNACNSIISQITHYFTNSDGFFFRPGTKTYFLLMYSVFWLNPIVYHAVLIILHIFFAIMFFLLALKIINNRPLAFLATLIFLISSGYLEAPLWISATGHLFNAVFIIASLYFYILWSERKNYIYYLLSFVSIIFSLIFHELGVVAPFLLLAYKISFLQTYNFASIKKVFFKIQNLLLFLPVIGYLVLRFISESHWFNGDYSYNLVKLPFNIVGNFLGYILLSLFGPIIIPFYTISRNILRDQLFISIPLILICLVFIYFALRKIYPLIDSGTRKIIIFSLLFSFIALAPFLGLGNLSPRYSYLATFGFIVIIVILFKYLYEYLLIFGKEVGLLVVTLIFSIFALFHIIQGQQQFIDWNSAGEKVENFLVTLDGHYNSIWSQSEINLNFSKVPIRNGEAWMFPVGLSDAVWFAFKSDNINVRTYPDSKSAYEDFSLEIPTYVLEFQVDGALRRVVKNKNGNLIYSE